MSELELFAKSIIDKGGEFWPLEEKGDIKMYKTITHYMVKGHEYNNCMYQIFKDGLRCFAHPDYKTALAFYRSLIKEGDRKNV